MARKPNPTDHAQRAHSELPPSSADKWIECHGWRKTVRQHIQLYGVPEAGYAAEEGTRAHEKLERHLLTLPALKAPPGKPAKEWAAYLGASRRELDPDDSEYDHLVECVEWIERQPGHLYSEARLDFGEGFGYVGLTGTVDVALVEPDRLTIADLKYGRMLVEVRDSNGRLNPQLMTYLVAAINRFGKRDRYRLAILQPRAYHEDGPIRVVEVSPAELEVFLFDLERAIDANYNDGAHEPGDHCRKFCTAMPTCRARIMADRARLLKGDENDGEE